MRLSFLKSAKLSVLTLVFAVSAVVGFTPSRSHALSGAVSGDAAMIALGALSYLGGYYIASASYYNGGPGWLLGFYLEVFGFILLDDNGDVNPRFMELTTENSAQLGITSQDAQAYNSELTQVNVIYQNVAQETQSFSEAHKDRAAQAAFATERWSVYKQNLSSATAGVVTKIQLALGEKLAQAKH
jgi:hypothetical protein